MNANARDGGMIAASDINPTALPLMPLDELAACINHAHEQFERAMRAAVEHAMEAGRLLEEAKKRVKHGEWLPWLKQNTHIPARTAQWYMQMARDLPSRLEAKSATVAHLTTREVRALLAEPKEAATYVVETQGAEQPRKPGIREVRVAHATTHAEPEPPEPRRVEVRMARSQPHDVAGERGTRTLLKTYSVEAFWTDPFAAVPWWSFDDDIDWTVEARDAESAVVTFIRKHMRWLDGTAPVKSTRNTRVVTETFAHSRGNVVRHLREYVTIHAVEVTSRYDHKPVYQAYIPSVEWPEKFPEWQPLGPRLYVEAVE